MEGVSCPKCKGAGGLPRCAACGKVSYALPEQVSEAEKKQRVPVPLWYQLHRWDPTHIVLDKNLGRTKTLEQLNRVICNGILPDFSAMFLLPEDSGKRIALFTLIQIYQELNYTVAPVLDLVTLNILLNRNRYEDQQTLLDLLTSDIAIIYSTAFVTRKAGARIFEGIASSRALTGKPTLFFGSHTFKEMSTWGTSLDIKYNRMKNDKLAHPYIFDGVAERRVHGQTGEIGGIDTTEQ